VFDLFRRDLPLLAPQFGLKLASLSET